MCEGELNRVQRRHEAPVVPDMRAGVAPVFRRSKVLHTTNEQRRHWLALAGVAPFFTQ